MRRLHLRRMIWVGWAASAALAQAQVQIYLPREIMVNDGALRLGTVAVVRGEPTAVETAGRVGLGQLVLPGQRMTIDRTTVLSRLASSGIPASQVTFTGADHVVVARAGHTISGTDLARTARQFAQEACGAAGVVQAEVVSTPKDLVIDGNQPGLQLVPRLAQAGRSSSPSMKVHIAVLSGTTEVAGQDVLVRIRYKGHKVIALGDLAKGTALSAENVRIEQGLVDQAPAPVWQPPYGRVLRRAVADATEIRDDSLTEPPPVVAVKRNEVVVIRLERPGVLITATGKTLSDGHVGETIKVRNIDSNRIVLCRVLADGSVEPVI
jgi:flagellar basal body P-ring formation protein FlgA